MPALVTLEDINFRLRLDLQHDGEAFTDPRVSDFEKLMADATAIVLDYCKKDDDEWDLETVPGTVSSAITLVVRNLYDEEEEPISEAVKALLHRHRDPSLA